MRYPVAASNDPLRAGQLASDSIRFGEFNRYDLFAVHTRFDAVSFFVKDAETPDDDGFATVIRQEPTPEAAVAGL